MCMLYHSWQKVRVCAEEKKEKRKKGKKVNEKLREMLQLSSAVNWAGKKSDI